jgi:peptidyl-prolyl cis-trans isomerase SurA
MEAMAQDQNKTVAGFKNFLVANYLSYDNYLKQIRAQILWSKIVNKNVASKIKISESEIREAIELRKIKSNEQRILLAEIYIPLNNGLTDKNYAGELSAKLVKELRGGKDFKNIVKQFSSDPGAENGGEIGWVGKNDLDSKIYQAIEKLKVGEISDPVLIKDGYHIFKIIDKKTIDIMTDEDINQIKNIIFNQRLQIEAKSYLMELRKNSFIEINRENIKLL